MNTFKTLIAAMLLVVIPASANASLAPDPTATITGSRCISTAQTLYWLQFANAKSTTTPVEVEWTDGKERHGFTFWLSPGLNFWTLTLTHAGRLTVRYQKKPILHAALPSACPISPNA